MYGYESWTIKKAEHWRIDAFELWHWRRFLRLTWTARRSNQLILKEISLEYSLEGLMLKLKFQYFGHLMQRTDSLENTLMLGDSRQEEMGTTEDEMVGWHHWLDGHAVVCLITQSCRTPCDPMDCSPPDSSIHRDSPGKNTGVGHHAFL